jgi:nitrogen fixation/metabolism regulation signal transduction histidine kinase
MTLVGRRGLTATLVALALLTVAACLLMDAPVWARIVSAAAAAVVYAALVRIVRRAVADRDRIITAVADGVAGLRDGDYSVSIAMPGNDAPLRRLVENYNGIGTRLRAQRQDLYQRELLLDTVIQATPLALVLTNANGTILYGNLAARQLFDGGHRLEGRAFEELLERAPAELREALHGERDTLFTTSIGGESQVFHLSQRRFTLNGQPHRLSLLKQLTREVNAQEVATWKKVIRVIAHEINNSVAPIASLAQSGQRLAAAPDPAQLERVFAAIEERMRHLSGFVEAYSRFAKLPRPRLAPVEWRRFLGSLRAMAPFEMDGPGPSGHGHFDESQLQQVLLNLLRNSAEAGSPAAEIRVSVAPARGGWLLQVADRGTGMSDEVLARALLPFYSTKPSGTGLGLTLCREIVEAHGGTLDLANRDGDGVTVRVWLPAIQGLVGSLPPSSTQTP